MSHKSESVREGVSIQRQREGRRDRYVCTSIGVPFVRDGRVGGSEQKGRLHLFFFFKLGLFMCVCFISQMVQWSETEDFHIYIFFRVFFFSVYFFFVRFFIHSLIVQREGNLQI